MPCLIDRVPTFVTGAYSNVSSPTTSRQSHQVPLRAGLVPALAPAPTDGLHRTAGPGACTASRSKTVNNAIHRWHDSHARLPRPQIHFAPNPRCQEVSRHEFSLARPRQKKWLKTRKRPSRLRNHASGTLPVSLLFAYLQRNRYPPWIYVALGNQSPYVTEGLSPTPLQQDDRRPRHARKGPDQPAPPPGIHAAHPAL